MNEQVQRLIEELRGEVCCRQHIGNDRSLFLRFGEVYRYTAGKSKEAERGKWDIGVYRCAWRIVRGSQILLGSRDAVDSVDDLRKVAATIEWGCFAGIRQLNEFDLRVEFDSGVVADILATTSDGDEVAHIFFPDNMVACFYVGYGWLCGPSDQPWERPGRQ
jgi:hypothetical protein